MCGYNCNNETCERPEVIKVAAQFVLEYLSTVPNASPLDTCIIHDAPPGLSDLVDRLWRRPFDRIPAHLRILLAVREVIFLFMSAGIHVAFPGYEVQRDPQSAQIVQDAYALDCRIRSA
eukprot:6907905-Pyramimonas_sp.AAC.1